jgi:hypothetical protein
MKFKDAAVAAKGYVTESMWGFDEIDAVTGKGARVGMLLAGGLELTDVWLGAHLPHAWERDKSTEVGATHHPKVCNPSAEGLLGPVSRTRTGCLAGEEGFEPSTF